MAKTKNQWVRALRLFVAALGLLGGALRYTLRLFPDWHIAWSVAVQNWRDVRKE